MSNDEYRAIIARCAFRERSKIPLQPVNSMGKIHGRISVAAFSHALHDWNWQMRLAVLLLLSLSIAGWPAQAGYDEALAALETEDFDTALKELRPLAEAGDARAQVRLGVLFANGKGVPKDQQEAVRWFRKSADQGNALGKTALGSMLLRGTGVPKDAPHGLRLLRDAAAKREPKALGFLGIAYFQGQGVGKNVGLALQYFRDAAELGNAKAQTIMGTILKEGKLTARNDVEAFKWFLKAAEQHERLAQIWVSISYDRGYGVEVDPIRAYMWILLATAQDGDPVPKGIAQRHNVVVRHDMSTEQIEASQRLAIAWVPVGKSRRYNSGMRELIEKARSGDADTMTELARRYSVGDRVVQNNTEAALWYARAAESGNARAQAALGAMYGLGEGVPRNEKSALNLFLKSAQQGDEVGQHNLGMTYKIGLGVSPDPVRALMWFNLAASHAPDHLRQPSKEESRLFVRDRAAEALNDAQIARAQAMAIAWMRKYQPKAFEMVLAEHWMAANRNDANAQEEIGKLFYDGKGVPRSYAEAEKWFRRAADNRSESAMYWLGRMHQFGHGVVKSDEAAFEWYRRGATEGKGDAKSQFSLAAYYRNGRIVAKDSAVAGEWYLKAAVLGLLIAQLTVAELYAAGDGLERNDASAFKWCTLVTMRGAPTAISSAAKSVCTSLRDRVSFHDRTQAETWAADWIAAHPSTKADPFWSQIMGTKKPEIDPEKAIMVR